MSADPLRGDPMPPEVRRPLEVIQPAGVPDRGPWVPRDLPPVTPEDSGEPWAYSWLTPDEARALRAAEAMRAG